MAGRTYTTDTLRDLRALHPDTELYFITGADALASILSWQDVEELFVDQQHAFVEVIAFFGMLECAVEVVEHRQEILDRFKERVLEVILFLAVAAFAVILEVSERAQVAVVELLHFCAQRGIVVGGKIYFVG